jgi:hypothetical protein
MKNTLTLLGLMCLGFLALAFAYSKKSDCFSCERVCMDAGVLQSASMPEQVAHLLNQEFRFLGSGNQSFAFVSADGAIVLKLIKSRSFQWEDLYLFLPAMGPLKKKQARIALKHQEKVARALNGFAIASEKDAEHCGIIYAQLAPSLKPFFIQVKDKAGRIHKLNLARCVFALQKKAVPLGQVLAAHLDKGELDQAREKLVQLFAMFAEELAAGIYDNDHNIIHNTGFTEEGPIRIDFGKLTIHCDMAQEECIQSELNKISEERIDKWLQSYYPNYAPQFQLANL